MRQCLLAEIAELQADVANVVSRNADAIRAQAGMDSRAAVSLAKAARYQTFLDVLREATDDSFRFRTAEVHITDQT